MKKWIILSALLCLVTGDNVVAQHAHIEIGSPVFVKPKLECVYLKELDSFVEPVSEKPGLILSSDQCGLLPGKHVSFVMDMFYEAYEKKFGDPDKKLKRHMANIVITASSKPRKVKNLYTTGGKHLDEAYVHGLFIKPNFIWLEVVPGSSIEDTALIHELVHYALHITKSEADPDHEGDKYKAWTKEHTMFISHLNYELRELMNGKVSD